MLRLRCAVTAATRQVARAAAIPRCCELWAHPFRGLRKRAPQREAAAVDRDEPGTSDPNEAPPRLDEEESDSDDDEVPLTTSEEQEITRELLAIELPTFKPVRRGAITAYDIMSPAAGAAWMRLPKNGMTVPLPSSWSMHEGQGRLLTLPYAQYVALPPGAAEGISGQRFAGVRSRDAPDGEERGTDAASAAASAAQDSVAGSPVAFVFTRYPKALKAPIIRGLNKPIGDLARFLVSFMVVKHGPAGLVTPRDPAASPSLDSMEGLEALDSSSSEVLQALEPEPSPENPAVTVLASWNTVADSPSGVAGAVHVFGLEFALPLQMEEPAAAAAAGTSGAKGAAASTPATTTLSMRFNSTLLLDTSTGDIHEVTFRCPEELWDMAWEGLAEEAAEMAAAEEEAGEGGAGRRGGARGGGYNRALDAVAGHTSDVWPGTPKATRQAAPEEPAAAAGGAHMHGGEGGSAQHMGRRRGRQRRRTEGMLDDAAAAATDAAAGAGGDEEAGEGDAESPWAGAPAGRRRRGRADRPEAGNEDIPALLRGFDVLSARQILDSATLTGEIVDTTPPPPPLPVSAKPARTNRKADALR